MFNLRLNVCNNVCWRCKSAMTKRPKPNPFPLGRTAKVPLITEPEEKLDGPDIVSASSLVVMAPVSSATLIAPSTTMTSVSSVTPLVVETKVPEVFQRNKKPSTWAMQNEALKILKQHTGDNDGSSIPFLLSSVSTLEKKVALLEYQMQMLLLPTNK